ncbi:MAG: hypothetical protein NC548_30360 [Lachnospiraceae bacterium]|nr:hypothetical protein [Lachnospiraceae bacterium]
MENNEFEVNNTPPLKPYVSQAKKPFPKLAFVIISYVILAVIILFCIAILYIYHNRNLELYNETVKLTADVDTLTESNVKLQAEMNDYQTETQKLTRQVEELTSKLEDKEKQEIIADYDAALPLSTRDFCSKPETYVGKRVILNCLCAAYDSESDTITTADFSDYGNNNYIIIHKSDGTAISDGSYCKINGYFDKLDGNHNPIFIESILCDGNAKEEYLAELDAYKEEIRLASLTPAELFKEEAVTVSYSDLRRYPETYQDKKIKLTIKITDVEPDGWIFDGDITAEYEGQELAVYDKRAVREPRLMKGDKLTVYAYGNGLAKMQVKQKGLVFDKTIDEYEIPCINLQYLEGDTNNQEAHSNTDNADMTEKGEELGSKLAETLAGLDP